MRRKYALRFPLGSVSLLFFLESNECKLSDFLKAMIIAQQQGMKHSYMTKIIISLQQGTYFYEINYTGFFFHKSRTLFGK